MPAPTRAWPGLEPGRRRPRVLVIPGLDGHPGLWRRVGSTALQGLRPVWFDHSGDRASGGFEGLAERALAAMDADLEGPAPAYILGESFGGPIALTLARRNPERVRGLILVSTFARYESRLTALAGLAAWRLLGDGVSEHVLRLSHPLTALGALGFGSPPEITQAYLRRPLVDIRAYRAKVTLSLQFDARAWLGEIQRRTFVLVGRSDPVVSASSGRLLVRHLPSASLYAMAGGHLAWAVRPAEVGGMLREWLAVSERHPDELSSG
ncbi:MAG TPA: alpha/beta fold hydrolase [Chloroflexota bacterium]